jgi:hypothetical protein
VDDNTNASVVDSSPEPGGREALRPNVQSASTEIKSRVVASDRARVAQLSLPYRIGLGALLVIAAVWFTVLKPKDPAAEPATSQAPGVTGLAADAGAAKGAATASDASATATQAAANAAGTSPATTGTASTAGTAATTRSTTASKPKATSVAEGDPSAPLLRALDRNHAVVLLFWDRRASDDAAVRRAVTAVDRRGGRAVVKAAPIRDVGRYRAITHGVQVLDSPTVLVIAPGRTARPIVGLTTTDELDQAVGDTLAAARKRKG